MEPIDERAIQFYKRQGFVNLGIASNFMYIPIDFIKEHYPAVSKMEITEEALIYLIVQNCSWRLHFWITMQSAKYAHR